MSKEIQHHYDEEGNYKGRIEIKTEDDSWNYDNSPSMPTSRPATDSFISAVGYLVLIVAFYIIGAGYQAISPSVITPGLVALFWITFGGFVFYFSFRLKNEHKERKIEHKKRIIEYKKDRKSKNIEVEEQQFDFFIFLYVSLLFGTFFFIEGIFLALIYYSESFIDVLDIAFSIGWISAASIFIISFIIELIKS